MPLYLVSYDIAEKNRDEYQELWDYLGNLGAVKILYSEYAVPFTEKASGLVDRIKSHLQKGDSLLVCELFDNNDTCFWTNLKVSDDLFRKLLTKYARSLN